MPAFCCANNCTNAKELKTGVELFPFPTDLVMAKKWRTAVQHSWRNTGGGRPAPHLMQQSFSYVCSRHFLDNDFVNSGDGRKNLLKPTAVPSVFFVSIPSSSVEKPRPSVVAQKKVFFDLPVKSRLQGQPPGSGRTLRPPDSPAQNCSIKVNTALEIAVIGHRLSELCEKIEKAKKRIEKLRVCVEITENFNSKA